MTEIHMKCVLEGIEILSHAITALTSGNVDFGCVKARA